jgi:hypothetical protein
MRTVFTLITTTIVTAIAATGASAEWRLYVNRDNKAWSLERTYLSNDECDRAARTMYRSGQALGVGCAEYPAPSATPAPAPRPAEYVRPASAARSIAQADEAARVSTVRASTQRVAERSIRPRQVAAAERATESVTASASHPAAVIFPPAGGMEVRSGEPAAAPAVASRPAPVAKRPAAPRAPQRPVEDSTAVALAKAATEGAVMSAQEVAVETDKREAAATADKAERRNQFAILPGIALVVVTGVAYSVYRAARTSPLRGLAVCMIELGLLASGLAYPAVPLWNRLRISSSVGSSWLPGLYAGIAIAGVGVIVLALDLARKPARPKAAAAARDADRKPAELIKPGEYVKTGEAGKTGEPVRPLTPIRPLEPVRPLDAPAPSASASDKPADAPAPSAPFSLSDRLVP